MRICVLNTEVIFICHQITFIYDLYIVLEFWKKSKWELCFPGISFDRITTTDETGFNSSVWPTCRKKTRHECFENTGNTISSKKDTVTTFFSKSMISTSLTVLYEIKYQTVLGPFGPQLPDIFFSYFHSEWFPAYNRTKALLLIYLRQLSVL